MKTWAKIIRFVLGNVFFLLFVFFPIKIIYGSWTVGEKLPDGMSFFAIHWLSDPAKIVAYRIFALTFGIVAIPYAVKGLMSLWQGKDFNEIP